MIKLDILVLLLFHVTSCSGAKGGTRGAVYRSKGRQGGGNNAGSYDSYGVEGTECNHSHIFGE